MRYFNTLVALVGRTIIKLHSKGSYPVQYPASSVTIHLSRKRFPGSNFFYTGIWEKLLNPYKVKIYGVYTCRYAIYLDVWRTTKSCLHTPSPLWRSQLYFVICTTKFPSTYHGDTIECKTQKSKCSQQPDARITGRFLKPKMACWNDPDHSELIKRFKAVRFVCVFLMYISLFWLISKKTLYQTAVCFLLGNDFTPPCFVQSTASD